MIYRDASQKKIDSFAIRIIIKVKSQRIDRCAFEKQQGVCCVTGYHAHRIVSAIDIAAIHVRDSDGLLRRFRKRTASINRD